MGHDRNYIKDESYYVQYIKYLKRGPSYVKGYYSIENKFFMLNAAHMSAAKEAAEAYDRQQLDEKTKAAKELRMKASVLNHRRPYSPMSDAYNIRYASVHADLIRQDTFHDDYNKREEGHIYSEHDLDNIAKEASLSNTKKYFDIDCAITTLLHNNINLVNITGSHVEIPDEYITVSEYIQKGGIQNTDDAYDFINHFIYGPKKNKRERDDYLRTPNSDIDKAYELYPIIELKTIYGVDCVPKDDPWLNRDDPKYQTEEQRPCMYRREHPTAEQIEKQRRAAEWKKQQQIEADREWNARQVAKKKEERKEKLLRVLKFVGIVVAVIILIYLMDHY